VDRNRDVIVALEPDDGQAERTEAVNRGLLAEGHRIANLTGGDLSALLTEGSLYDRASWARTAHRLLEETPFRLLLFAHTDRGRELAPLVAHSFSTPAVLDCFDIRFKNDSLHYARYVYGGQFEREVSFAGSPEIVTQNPERLERADAASVASIQYKVIRIRVSECADRKKTLEIVPPDYRTVDIRYSKRILDLGAGCDQPELLKLAGELAVLLEASTSATRLLVDSGRISKTRMIGQTGKDVSPELCLLLGVSGSPHHCSGIRNSGKILSVNSDERAPVFEVSDTGFVSNLQGLLPKLIRRIIQFRDEGLT